MLIAYRLNRNILRDDQKVSWRVDYKAIFLIDLSECRDLSPKSVEPNVACDIGLSRCFADLVFPTAATSKRSFHARRRDSCG
jgi:hypothetical protein